MPDQNDRRIDRVFILVLFGAALATHFYLATINWKLGFLPGHEFRQSQTAINAYYIDQQNNFSVHYETPILGKPWEIPLEFPLYEWSVVWLSRATGWTHVIAARSISLASFYLSLPAIYLLLGQAGLSRVRRLLGLGLLLATPVYIFYSRAFLIDPMAFMLSAWFLALFVETMRKRQAGLFLACALCGTAAGLIKSLVLFAWLFPAALYGAYWLWGDFKEKRGQVAIARTLAWGLGTVLAPAIAMTWWVRMTDAIKAKHSSAYIFTSQSLSHDNYGTFSLSSRTSLRTWKEFSERWQEAITQPWVLGAVVGLGLVFFPRERWRIGLAIGLFFAAQLLIPYAYRDQDYYYYICSAFMVCALGFVLNGVMDSRWPRPAKWVLIVLPFVPLLQTYRGYYFKQQSVKSFGGTGLTATLKDFLPEKSVIVVSGADWAAMIPYYSQHRALMIRNGLEKDQTYMAKAFKDLEDEDVGAVVLIGDRRNNRTLLDLALPVFNLDPSPTITWANEADVYVSKLYRAKIVDVLGKPSGYSGIKVAPDDSVKPTAPRVESFPRATMAEAFKMIRPAPTSFKMQFGYGTWEIDGQTVLIAHPDSDIWLAATPTSKQIELSFGLRREAYERPGAKTNGVKFIVDAESPNGNTRELFSRVLDPVSDPKDRGLQKVTCELALNPEEKLVLRTRANGDYAYDWAYWSAVMVK